MSEYNKFFHQLFQDMQDTALEKWADRFAQQLQQIWAQPHGDYSRWSEAFRELPDVGGTQADCNSHDLNIQCQLSVASPELINTLKKLSPWRKGPYRINDIYIDTEWHSDWKWQRIKNHISPLHNRLILDVGCGNGYHCWRIHGEGARLVIGIDPSWLFLIQFQTIKHFMGEKPVYYLPMGIQQLPEEINAFDTVFSMGVLYHRRSPVDHILQLKNTLRSGGELVLETLVIEGGEREALVPDDRYAKMRNVWFLPTTSALCQWLQRCGFKAIRVVDVNQTSIEEQRSTEWMPYESLENFLDPEDHNKTIEGYPAPLRATIIAQKP